MSQIVLCKRKSNRRARLFAGVALLGFAATAFAASFTATLDRDTVAVGEAAVLTLTFEGGSPKSPPQLPALQNLRVGYGGQSSSFSWNNGVSSSTISYTYQLAPTTPGEFALPPLAAVVGSETLHSPAVTLKAVRAEAATPDATNADQQLVLLKLFLPRKQIYLGEIIPVEVQIFLNPRVQGIQQNQISPPAGDGLVFGKQIQGQQRNVKIGNTTFNVIPLYYTMTANKTGALTLNAVDATFVVQLPPNGQPPRDNFDPFGIFNRNETKRVTLSSDAETLEVLPLPDGAPASFNGSVGNYSMNFAASPTDLTAGDPITVKIQINGRGALDALALPTQAAWSEFKTYPPTAKLQLADQLGLQGAKNFELVVVPQSPELHALPPFEFSFFDPEKKSYATLKHPGVALTVRPSAASAAAPTLAGVKAEPAATKRELAPIKLELGRTRSRGAVSLAQVGAWTLAGISALAYVGLFARRRQAESLANNPRLRRQRAVAASLASGLADLREFAAGKNSEQFFATLFRLIQEQLGERLDVPAASVTESVIEEKLRPRGVVTPALERLHELFQACNLARFAPVKSSHELEAFIPKLETVLEDMKGIE